jgi:hypothetical protein
LRRAGKRRSGGDRHLLVALAGLCCGMALSAFADVRRVELPNGDIYEGEVEGGQRTGTGTYLWRNGNRYEGEFVDGAREGLGTYYWRDGTIYQGEFSGDRMNGFGVKRLPDGHRELQRWQAGELLDSRPLREIPHCRLVLNGRNWMFESDECINGLAHGRGLAASLDGEAVVPDGRFVLGRLVEGDVHLLRRDGS